jgi:hypothetical protein
LEGWGSAIELRPQNGPRLPKSRAGVGQIVQIVPAGSVIPVSLDVKVIRRAKISVDSIASALAFIVLVFAPDGSGGSRRASVRSTVHLDTDALARLEPMGEQVVGERYPHSVVGSPPWSLSCLELGIRCNCPGKSLAMASG